MRRGVLLLLVVAVVVGGAYAQDAGIGPFAEDSEDDVSDFPGAGDEDDGRVEADDTDGSSSDGTVRDGQGPSPSFAFEIRAIEKCGRTCRDVTAALHNTGDGDASGVTVYTRLYAGNSTASDDRIWSGKRQVGALAAGENDVTTERVELSLSEGLAVRNAGGWITSRTQVESDDVGVVAFEERYEVG